LDNEWIQTYFLENERKKVMVKKGKELRNVKDEGASCHILDPSHANEMG